MATKVLKDLKAEYEAKIAQLEAEKLALMGQVKTPGISLAKDKHGNTVISFVGNFRPFDITLQRAKKLAPYLKEIAAFVKSGGTSLT